MFLFRPFLKLKCSISILLSNWLKPSLFVLLFAANLSLCTLTEARNFQSIPLNTGIPSRYVHHIESLSNGYLLFSTNSGARLYDGYKFIPIIASKKTEINPFDSTVYTTKQDRAGFIWFGTTSGLFKLDPKTSQLTRFANDPNNPNSLVSDYVKSIFEDSRGYIWFGTANGLSRYDPTNHVFTQHLLTTPHNVEKNAYDIRFIVEDQQQRIWHGGSNGSFYFDYKDNQFHQPKQDIFKQFGTSAIISENGKLWLATFNNGLYEIDTRSSSFSYNHYQHKKADNNSLISDSIWRLFEDKQGLIWTGHWDRGLSILDPQNSTFERHTHNSNDLASIPGSAISGITNDKSGLIWIATASGAASYNPDSLKIEQLTHKEGEPQSLLYNEVWSFLESNNHSVWIGTSRGLDLWNTHSKQLTHFVHNTDDPTSISPGAIWAIKTIDNSTLLLATDTGLNLFDITKSEFSLVPGIAKDSVSNQYESIYQIHQLNNNQFLVGGTSGNIYKFNAVTGQIKLLIDRQKYVEMNNIEFIDDIKADSKGNVWFGTTTGLFRFNIANQTIIVFNTDSRQHALKANNIESLAIDKNDVVWAGTRGGGLQKIEVDQNNLPLFKISYITTYEGLPENTINTLVLDSKDHLWFTTSAYIGRIDIQTGKIKTISTESNYNFQFSAGTSHQGQSGYLYLGGEGLYRFDPTKIKESNFSPPVVITSVSTMHEVYDDFSPLLDKSTVEFTAKDTLTTFSFAALDYSFPNLNRYRYKLEGVDNEWLLPKSEHQATYSHLPFGKFLFRVQGSNSDGKWGDKEAQLLVIVKAPWWQTNLAYTLYLLLISLIIFAIILRFKHKREEERQYHKAIRDSETRLKNTLWGSGEELWHWDLNNAVILRTNLVFQLTTNQKQNADYDPEQLAQQDLLELIHPDDKKTFDESIEYHLAGQSKYFEIECRLNSHEIGYQWVLIRGRTIEYSDNGIPAIIAGTVRDIAEIKKKEQALTTIANYDQLTGLPNRNLFKEQLAHAISQAKRFNESVALLFLDLDAFKLINDTHGHGVGDELLVKVAERLKITARTSDNVARLGGDEFTVIVERVSSQNSIVFLLERLIDDLNHPYELQEHTVNTAVSIGVAVYPEDGEDVKELLKSADIAMYEAKKAGKGTFRFYTKKMNVLIHERMVIEDELRAAIRNQDFEVFYQPKVSVSNGDILGVEALVRWNHPEKGLIQPDSFIPIAEENGLIVHIGQTVLYEACRQCSLWRKRGWQGVVSVNSSAKEVQQVKYIERIQEVLNSCQLPASALELEVTEGVFISNLKHTQQLLQKIRDKGVRLALDDFGTGFSSLAYLKNLPIDTLKIDRSFIWEIETDKRTYHLVKAIVQMAQSLDLDVVAEGIESKEQLDVIREFGCHEYQGYYFSKPVSAAEIEKLIFNN